MNTIAIIGSNWKVGRFFVNEALKNKYKVKVLIRDPKKLNFFTHYLHENVEIIIGDAKSKEDIFKLLENCKAVINTVGHKKNCGDFYANITTNILEGMKFYGIKRYIGIASENIFENTDKRGVFQKLKIFLTNKIYKIKMEDKKNAVSILKNSEINWSVYRIPKVVESKEIKDIKLNDFSIGGYSISNKNLAKFIVSQIDNKENFGKIPFIWE